MGQMNALVKEKDTLQICQVPLPELQAKQVLIQVQLVGVCRTDISVMQGHLQAPSPLIPGHEFVGVVSKVHDPAHADLIGQQVTVDPLLPCHQCSTCQEGHTHLCPQADFLGLTRHGAFAEYIAVPAKNVHPIPGLSLQEGAYSEPVAAAAAVLKAPILPHHKGLICGNNRISKLVHRILKHTGFEHVDINPHTYPPNTYDFVIETVPLPGHIWKSLKPGGKLILKSRHAQEISLPLHQLVQKEIQIHALYYGNFKQSLALLPHLQLQDFFGKTFELNAFEDMLTHAVQHEQKKIFVQIAPCAAS